MDITIYDDLCYRCDTPVRGIQYAAMPRQHIALDYQCRCNARWRVRLDTRTGGKIRMIMPDAR